MGVKKLTRVVRVRKWFVIGVAMVGAIIGYLVAARMNEGREPQYEATASIEFGSAAVDERNRDPEAEQDLTNALVAAEVANQGVIDDGLGRVVSNPQAGELLFTARSREESVAADTAEAMRSAYLESTTQGSAEDRQRRLEEIVTEASGILAQLNELNPATAETEELDPELDPDVAARLEVLDSLVTGMTQQHTKLEVDLILAEAGDERVGEPEDIQAELEAVTERLNEIYAEIAQISAENDLNSSQITGRQTQGEETPEESADTRTSTDFPAEAYSPDQVETQWTIDALESRYEDLAAEYEALFIEDTGEDRPELRAVEVADLTPSRAPGRVFTGLGFVVGAVLAAGLAMGEAVWTDRVYVLSDTTPLSGLAEVPAVRSLVAGWLPMRTELASRRRIEGIHRLRIALLGMLGSNAPSPAIGLTRVGVDPVEPVVLATDLASRLAASGRSILVLDVDFDVDTTDSVPASSYSVADLIAKAKADPEAAATQMKEAFAGGTSTESFRFITSGKLNEDPADVLLTDAFWMLLEVAREQSDIVLLVTSEAADHSTSSLQQRINGQIAVCAVGKTHTRTLLKLAQPTVVTSVGVVLLTGWRRLGFRNFTRVSGETAERSGAWRGWLDRRRRTGESSSEPGI